MSQFVYVLTYGADVVGVFDTREGAEKQIVRDALCGLTIENASLTETIVQTALPNPLSLPSVVFAIQESKKILAIKEYRTEVPGLGLKEAKDAIEGVWDSVPKLEMEPPF